MGVLVWFMVGIRRANVVTIPAPRLAEFGLDRFAFYRGLAALERRGLVSVERRRGATARITLVDGGPGHTGQRYHAAGGHWQGVHDDMQK